eukprot:TRINITY_DN18123_c1_g2_i2.p1 TRINITY_DN18123_c1_g2~~TRINITY_DN18123_c1_g2_i2.p1  ORF type:complete len:475 (-),score=90.44 TRINITY_DN18123_c1_g2_i2:534-1958(-)
MPIELEGYIRPGCTILTLFIAMPRFMWVKLSEDALSYVNDLVNAPESLLSGRPTMRIYLNDMIFQVVKDGMSLINIKVRARVPRLHYVHPAYFEAGKPIEFVVCGTDLFQPKFRLLMSFGGKYLACESCLAIPQKNRSAHAIDSESTNSCDHEMFKIYIPGTDLNLFGPAFIEVENESGLSNFIPVLIGDRQICTELEMIRQRSDKVLYSESAGTQFAETDGVPNSCQAFISKETAMSDLLLDIAWLLKEPQLDKSENGLTSTQVQRMNCLLRFLIQNQCVSILERILHSLMNVMEAVQLYDGVNKTNDADIRSFQKYMAQARKILDHKVQCPERSITQSENCPQMVYLQKSEIKSKMLYSLPSTNQGMDVRMEDGLPSTEASASQGSDLHVSLINKEVVMDVNNCPRLMKGRKWPQKACAQVLPSSIKKSHLVVLSMAAVAVCFGICAAVSYPHEVRRFAVTMRRCLFGTSMP